MRDTKIFKTQKQAEMYAKRKACDTLGVQYSSKRYFIVKPTSTQCVCGQTSAIRASAQIMKGPKKGHWVDEYAGFCNMCGDSEGR